MKIVGHRGARGLAPENTIAGLKKGLENNVDQIEIDVHVTSDGVPIVHHDYKLLLDDRSRLKISTHTLKELQAANPNLITLADAIQFVNRRVPMCIEVKFFVPTPKIAAVIKSFLGKGWKDSDFFILSFSYKILLDMHKKLPGVQTVVLGMVSGVWATYRARRLNTKYISMWHRNMWSGFVRAMNRKGYKLYIWTLNDPAKAKRFAKYGAYGVVTDYPDRFKK